MTVEVKEMFVGPENHKRVEQSVAVFHYPAIKIQIPFDSEGQLVELRNLYSYKKF